MSPLVLCLCTICAEKELEDVIHNSDSKLYTQLERGHQIWNLFAPSDPLDTNACSFPNHSSAPSSSSLMWRSENMELGCWTCMVRQEKEFECKQLRLTRGLPPMVSTKKSIFLEEGA
jgi:hypothetical protein